MAAREGVVHPNGTGGDTAEAAVARTSSHEWTVCDVEKSGIV